MRLLHQRHGDEHGRPAARHARPSREEAQRRLEIALIDRPDQPPLGAGEAASSPVPAALANAVFDATGVRLRSVRFSSDKLKSLLA